MHVNLNDISQFGNILKKSVDRLKQDTLIFYEQDIYASIGERVWGGGSGTKDIDGKKLPRYNKKYAESHNKTSKTWDLQDTGSLKQSFKPRISEGKIELGFISQEEAQVAQDLEQRADTVIFSPNKKEISRANRKTIKYIISTFEADLKQMLK